MDPGKKRTGLAGFGSLSGAGEEDESKKKGNDYYAGGASSGQAVHGRPEEGEHAVDSVKRGAREAGAVVDAHEEHQRSFFTGAGHSLSGASVQGAPVAAAPVTRVLSMYDDGFCVDDGPFRAFSDPENAQFLQDVEAGLIPRELEAEANGAQLQVDLVDKRGSKYKESEAGRARPSVASFSGAAHALSSSSDGTAVAAREVTVDPALPTARVLLRGADGSREVATLNVTHTVGDLAAWLCAKRGLQRVKLSGGVGGREYGQAEFALTLAEAKLAGGTLMWQ